MLPTQQRPPLRGKDPAATCPKPGLPAALGPQRNPRSPISTLMQWEEQDRKKTPPPSRSSICSASRDLDLVCSINLNLEPSTPVYCWWNQPGHMRAALDFLQLKCSTLVSAKHHDCSVKKRSPSRSRTSTTLGTERGIDEPHNSTGCCIVLFQ